MTRRLRILLDARMLIGRFSGVARVVTELAENFARHKDLEVVVLCGNQFHSPWIGRADIEVVTTSFSRQDRSPLRRCWWEAVHICTAIRTARVDLFHATWNSGIPARCPVPTVLTIHDLIPWHHDQEVGKRLSVQRAAYRHAMRVAARRATWITTVSEFVRQDVIRTLRVSPEKVIAVANGVRVSPYSEPLDRAHMRSYEPPAGGRSRPKGACALHQPHTHRPYVLYVGGHERRKNVAAVLRAMLRYWHRFGWGLSLHLTGSPETLEEDARQVYEGLRDKGLVRFLGTLPDDELQAQYASASLCVLLSKAEGFGLPVLEAMAHGCPVVAANRAALPEVVGDAGILVDPDQPDEVVEAIHRMLTDQGLRERVVRTGRRRASGYTWERTADCMRDLYERFIRTTSHPLVAEAGELVPVG